MKRKYIVLYLICCFFVLFFSKHDSSIKPVKVGADVGTTLTEGSGIINNNNPRIILTDPYLAATITVEDGTNNPTLDISSLITDGSGFLPQITINTNIVNVSILDGTIIISENASWNGIFNAPMSTTVTLPETYGETKNLITAFEIGTDNTRIYFDKAIRMEFVGQAGGRAGFFVNDVFTETTTICGGDFGNDLGVTQECKINIGSNLIIWTRHFTKFAIFSSTTTTITPTNTPTPEDNSSSQTTTSNGWAAPACTATKPSKAPVITKIINNENNSVTLTWEKAGDPVTYYLIAYGTSPGSIQYGNPNVGNADTTNYTVKGLSSGNTYYFRVKAVNDCTPGDWSNEVSSIAKTQAKNVTNTNLTETTTSLAEDFTPVSELPSQLFDIALIVDNKKTTSVANLGVRVTFISFGSEETPVEMTFTILDENGREYYRSINNISIETEGVFNKSFEGLTLNKGKYKIVLTTLYNKNIKDEFKQEFEITDEVIETNKSLMIGIQIGIIFVLIILIIILSIKRQRI